MPNEIIRRIATIPWEKGTERGTRITLPKPTLIIDKDRDCVRADYFSCKLEIYFYNANGIRGTPYITLEGILRKEYSLVQVDISMSEVGS